MRGLLTLLTVAAALPARAETWLGPQALEPLRAAVAGARTLAPAAPPSPAPFVLRVLTYNIHGILPKARPDEEEEPEAQARSRFREIARRLRALREEGRAPHVVALQEAFNPWADAAAKEAGYPFLRAGAGPRLGKLGGSGLWILSEFPVERAETLDYRDCTGFDCLANKGALHVRVFVPALLRSLDLYGTHMNADEPPAKPEDSMAARVAQIREFAAFVARTRAPKAPLVAAGDFNFLPGNADYAAFASRVPAGNPAESCAAAGACTGDAPGPVWRASVDHHFFAAAESLEVAPSHFAQTFKEPHEGKPLSDHLGLEVHYLLRPR